MFVLTSLLPLIAYILTLSNTIYGGDAGDFVSAVLTRGVAHPPGYPLFILLGIITNSLPFSLTAAGKVTIVSVIATVLGLILLYKILEEFFGTKLNKAAAIITVWAVGFNYLVWLYAVVPEAFALNIPIVLGLYLSALRFYKTGNLRYLFLTALLTGLGLTHHHTFLLILPSVTILIFGKKNKELLKPQSIFGAIFLFFLGFAPYLYTVIVSFKYPEISWGAMNTVPGFIYVFLRQGYGTFQAGGFISQNYLHRLLQLKNLAVFTSVDFSIIGFIWIVIGILVYLRRLNSERTIILSYLVAIVLYGPFFVFYANFPLFEQFDFATVERFYLIIYFLAGIALYQGIQISIVILNKILNKYVRTKQVRLFAQGALIGVLFLYPFLLFAKNIPYIYSLKNDRTAENLGYDILDNTDRKSILILGGDTVLFDTQYVYYANKNNYKDKILIHASKLPVDYYVQTLKKNYPQLNISPTDYNLKKLIQLNENKFSIYSNNKFEILDKEHTWQSEGLLFKYIRVQDQSKEEQYKKISEVWASYKNRDLDTEFKRNPYKQKNLYLTEVLRNYATAHINTAYFLIQYEKLLEARYHLAIAHDLNPNDNDYYYLLSLYYAKLKDCDRAVQAVDIALKKKNDPLYFEQLASVANNCYTDEKKKSEVLERIGKMNLKQQIPLQTF